MKVIFPVLALCLLMQILHSCRPNNKTGANAQVGSPDSIEARLELVSDDVVVPVECNTTSDKSGRIFITDNSGVIRILKKDSLLPVPFLDLRSKRNANDSASPVGQINSVAFHPDYDSNGKFYVCYNGISKILSHPGKLVIASFTASHGNIDIADPLSEKQVLELEGQNIVANGAMIGFGPDGYLYISIGDDAIGDSNYVYHAQDLNYLNGKILRIDVNQTPYSIPADNPFIGVKQARPEVWAYGFRKVWRFSFDPVTRNMFGADCGEQEEEEINLVVKGGNYGWPVMEGYSHFNKTDSVNHPGFIAPINSYSHKEGLCIIGGFFYTGNDLSLLKENYVFADFNGSIFSLMKNENDEWARKPLKILNKPPGQFMICGVNADYKNEIYVMGILVTQTGGHGVIYKVVKASV